MTGAASDGARLEAVLADLLGRGVLTAEQASAVQVAFAAGGPPTGPGESVAVERPGPLRKWLVEAAAYLGAVLVSASLLVIAAQRWPDLSFAQQLALLLSLGAAVGVAGGYVVWSTPGRGRALREPARAAYLLQRPVLGQPGDLAHRRTDRVHDRLRRG